jgi:hypothetical protein
VPARPSCHCHALFCSRIHLHQPRYGGGARPGCPSSLVSPTRYPPGGPAGVTKMQGRAPYGFLPWTSGTSVVVCVVVLVIMTVVYFATSALAFIRDACAGGGGCCGAAPVAGITPPNGQLWFGGGSGRVRHRFTFDAPDLRHGAEFPCLSWKRTCDRRRSTAADGDYMSAAFLPHSLAPAPPPPPSPQATPPRLLNPRFSAGTSGRQLQLYPSGSPGRQPSPAAGAGAGYVPYTTTAAATSPPAPLLLSPPMRPGAAAAPYYMGSAHPGSSPHSLSARSIPPAPYARPPHAYFTGYAGAMPPPRPGPGPFSSGYYAAPGSPPPAAALRAAQYAVPQPNRGGYVSTTATLQPPSYAR